MSYLWHLIESHPWLNVSLLVSAAMYGVYRLLKSVFSRPKIDVKHKTVLITGASSGLGRSLAFRFHKAGAKMILVARSLDKLEQLSNELKAAHPDNSHEPSYRYLDVAEPNGISELTQLSPDGHIDILVNNAGQSMRGPCSSTTMKVQRHIMNVNYFGQIEITQALIDSIPDDGSIVVISSIQALIAVPYRSAYSASKHALQAYFDCLRGEQCRLNILTVCPGYINTNLGENALCCNGHRDSSSREQVRGMSADYVADRIFAAVVHRQDHLVIGSVHHRWAVFVRHLSPSLFFYFMRHRALKSRQKDD